MTDFVASYNESNTENNKRCPRNTKKTFKSFEKGHFLKINNAKEWNIKKNMFGL